MDVEIDADQAAATRAETPPPSKSDPSIHPKPEELVAKAIAPVKAEYLRPPPPTRPRSNGDAIDEEDEGERKGAAAAASGVVKEKKSKRQLKRERRQEQNSVLNICPEVAKHGSADACRYSGNCRFSHDLDAFLAQKPADLEGCCPFLSVAESCPYGITCRFFNTHKESSLSEKLFPSKKIHETNTLNKDLRRLLWKNKVSFSKADAQLKLLGLRGANNRKESPSVCKMEGQEDNLNGSTNLHVDDSGEMPRSAVNDMECASVTCIDKDCLADAPVVNESRPLKKIKCPVDEPCYHTDISNV